MGALLPVKDPQSRLTRESRFHPDRRTLRDTRGAGVARCLLPHYLGKEETKHTDIARRTNMHAGIRARDHAQRCLQEASGRQRVRNDCSLLIRVKTYSLVLGCLSHGEMRTAVLAKHTELISEIGHIYTRLTGLDNRRAVTFYARCSFKVFYFIF